MCHNPTLVRHKPLGARASVKLVEHLVYVIELDSLSFSFMSARRKWAYICGLFLALINFDHSMDKQSHAK